jgi:uncharacterized protein (DUF1810 family)
MPQPAKEDKHNLQRFVDAQDAVYPRVCSELRAGRKRSHWMWFVFPQLAGLGSSDIARHFAIASIGEAAEYLAHPVLGTRLRECTQLVVDSATALDDLFGYPDNLKFRSCMTLFAQVPGGAAFKDALEQLGETHDPATLKMLAAHSQ